MDLRGRGEFFYGVIEVILTLTQVLWNTEGWFILPDTKGFGYYNQGLTDSPAVGLISDVS
jgi:hypothetical protein